MGSELYGNSVSTNITNITNIRFTSYWVYIIIGIVATAGDSIMLLSRFRDILSRCSVGWIPYASRRLIGLLRRKKTLHLACIVTRWKRRATLLSSWRKEPARSSWAKTAVRTPAGESGPGVGVGVGVRVVGVGLWR